jgi:hypothetical protein
MDFRGGMTQAQIGQRLRISQMHVSRLRTHALGYLHLRLLDLDGTLANARPGLAPRSPAGRASVTSANRLYGGRLHPHRVRGDRGEHPRGRRPGLPRDAACTACRPPASPRSPERPGTRSPSLPPTTRGQCCGASPTPPTRCRPSSAAHKPCPGDSARRPKADGALIGPDTVRLMVTPLRRAVTTVRSESKCLLPMVSKAQATLRSTLPLR